MTHYEEIIALRQELKKPGIFRHNHIQMRMLVWHLTIGSSIIFKRFMDIILAVLAVVLGSPVFLITALLVKLTSPGPIIFSQVRVGRFGRHFKFYKFRSMYIDAEARKAELLKHNESGDGVIFKMKHDPRITPIGRFIRKFSIDELAFDNRQFYHFQAFYGYYFSSPCRSIGISGFSDYRTAGQTYQSGTNHFQPGTRGAFRQTFQVLQIPQYVY